MARGGRVVCADINLARARETADQLGRVSAHPVACDVSSYDEIVKLADVATDWLGHAPDLVINNAGIGTGGKPIGEVSMDDWNATIGINMYLRLPGLHAAAAGTGIRRHHQRIVGRQLRGRATDGSL
ncbi:Putative short chain dehydrogenase/reductase [Mycobacteroides abscessus subsp. massiliense]|nr:Putative short chain dehydrogenase/reductase [Mycobacteroides abscessus subsp. massiliense]